jgi:hypothetical protein
VVLGEVVSKSLEVRGGREAKLDRVERIQWSKYDSQVVNEEQAGVIGHIVQPLYTSTCIA